MNDANTSTTGTTGTNDWRETLNQSATLLDRSTKGRAKATAMLFDGAKAAIAEWTDSGSDDSGEVLYADVMDALGGRHRKGDASKVRTVALAVANNGLDLDATTTKVVKGKETTVPVFPNLASAYKEATRLTKTVAQHAAEDTAADEATQRIAGEAPKSASKPESAAMLVLAQGVDEAARLLVNVLNGEGEQADLSASRALLRALSQEIAGRVPKPQPKPKSEKKAPAKKATAKKATVSDGSAKAKPKAAPAKTAAAKAKPVAAKPKPVSRPEPVEAVEESDIFDEFDLDSDETETVEAPAPVAKAKPRGPVRRG